MRRSSLPAIAAASLLGALVGLVPGTAHATYLSACGNIDIDLSGGNSCQFETSGGCTAQCTPVNVDATCAAQLETSCTSDGCSAMIDASCSTTCEGNCETSCMANQGSFSCSGSCEADCSGHCMAQCSSDAHQDECTASCQQSCGANCNASCTGTTPSVSCMTQCQSSCQGSCQAQANLSCNINCQEMGYASCQTTVTGGCSGQCMLPTGALFCNGQYVDLDGVDLTACQAQLASLLNVNISLTGSATCSGGNCAGSASASCGQIAPGAVPPLTEGVFALGLGVAVVGVVRRRVRKSKQSQS